MEERDRIRNSKGVTAVGEASLDFRLLFEAVPDPCLVLDRELHVVAVNTAYLAVTMTEREKMLGRHLFDVFPSSPHDPEATGVRNLNWSLERVLKNRVTDVMELQRYDIRRPAEKGGEFEERFWSVINAPVPGAGGEVAFIIHRVQDVTKFVHLRQKGSEGRPLSEEMRERAVLSDAESYNRGQDAADINARLKQANDELERKNEELQVLNQRLEQEAAARVEAQAALKALNAELQRSNRDLELFASVTSHDLQEPLHTITSYTELLARKYGERLDQKTERYIDFITDGTSRMHAMINDLLAYSRVGTRAKPFAAVDLDAVLNQAWTNVRRAVEQSGGTFEAERLPQVQGDDGQLVQLFQNLLSNAVKFRKKDAPLVIRVTCRQDDKQWRIGVHDNGIGIEERFFDQIFEIFRRLHVREEYEGTGIGLAICKKIVEYHGGRIWVESTFGEGTTLYFTLPGGAR